MHDPAAALTVAQRILVAAYKLKQAGQDPVTIEALTVAGWKLDNKCFGLRGFDHEYPDSNRFYCCVMGERGLARRGWLVKVGQKLYSLSRQGVEEARRVLNGDGSCLPKRRALGMIQVPKDLELPLVALFTTTAFRRFGEGMKREITYRDACRFWGLAENASGDAVDGTLAKVPAMLAAVEQLLIGNTIELSNGQNISRGDLATLCEVHNWLTETFARNLRQQRERRGRIG